MHLYTITTVTVHRYTLMQLVTEPFSYACLKVILIFLKGL